MLCMLTRDKIDKVCVVEQCENILLKASKSVWIVSYTIKHQTYFYIQIKHKTHSMHVHCFIPGS